VVETRCRGAVTLSLDESLVDHDETRPSLIEERSRRARRCPEVSLDEQYRSKSPIRLSRSEGEK
jgi:hypothetical protein